MRPACALRENPDSSALGFKLPSAGLRAARGAGPSSTEAPHAAWCNFLNAETYSSWASALKKAVPVVHEKLIFLHFFSLS